MAQRFSGEITLNDVVTVAYTRVLVLDPGLPVPPDTAAGTVILDRA